MIDCITLTNQETEEKLVLGSYRSQSEDYVLSSVDWGTVKASFGETQYIGQVGTTKINTILQPRTVSISGYVVNWSGNTDEMTQKMKVINDFFLPTQEVELLYQQGESYYVLNMTPSESVKWSTKEKTNNEVLAQFSLSFEAFDPMFYYYENGEPNILSFDDSTYYLRFPAYLRPRSKVTMGSDPYEIAVRYKGEMPSGVLFTLVCLEAISTGVRIELIHEKGTVQTFSYTGPLVAGDTLVINTKAGTRGVTLNGENAIEYMGADSEWLTLSSGITALEITPRNSLSVTLEFWVGFLEVQGA